MAYRAYIVGPDDHITGVRTLDCHDDHAAVEEARQFVKGHDVEVWERGRHEIRLTSPVAQPVWFKGQD